MCIPSGDLLQEFDNAVLDAPGGVDDNPFNCPLFVLSILDLIPRWQPQSRYGSFTTFNASTVFDGIGADDLDVQVTGMRLASDLFPLATRQFDRVTRVGDYTHTKA